MKTFATSQDELYRGHVHFDADTPEGGNAMWTVLLLLLVLLLDVLLKHNCLEEQDNHAACSL